MNLRTQERAARGVRQALRMAEFCSYAGDLLVGERRADAACRAWVRKAIYQAARMAAGDAHACRVARLTPLDRESVERTIAHFLSGGLFVPGPSWSRRLPPPEAIDARLRTLNESGAR
jgi:hypothetical protein